MTSNKPLTIVGLEISGYKRIRAINLKPEPTGTGVWIEDGLAVGEIAQEVV